MRTPSRSPTAGCDATDRPDGVRGGGDPTRDFLRFRTDGDPGALAAVFDAVAPRLLLLALHLTRNRADAEDAVQETFVAAIGSAADFDGARDVGAWLSGILAHRARDLRRRRARGLDPARAATPALRTPVEAAIDAEALAQVDAAIDALPDAYREVLVLRLHHGLTGREIARALGRPIDTVHTQLRRGLDALRRRLPEGLALALERLDDAGRGLARVRAAVLDGVGAPPPLVAGFLLGGLGMKKLVFACSVALALVCVAVQPLRDGASTPASTVGDASSLPAIVAVDRGVDEAPALSREPVAASPVEPAEVAPAFVVRGRCLDGSSGGAVSGCEVRVGFRAIGGAPARPVDVQVELAATSALDGSFHIPSELRPESSLSVVARADGYVAPDTTRSVDRDAAEQDLGTIVLVRGWRPSGTAVDPAGRAARDEVGLRILAREGGVTGIERVQIGAAGSFACTTWFPPGRLEVGCDDGWQVLSVEPDEYRGDGPAPALRVVVDRITGSLSGVVVDRGGVPVGGAIVVVYTAGDRRGSRQRIGEALADEQGRFEVFPTMPYGGAVRVEVGDRGAFLDRTLDPRTFQWGEGDLRIEMDRRGRAVLEVVDAVDGAPVASIDYEVRGAGSSKHTTSNQPDGRFELALPAGVHDVIVRSGSRILRREARIRVDMPAADGRTIRVALPRVAPRRVLVRLVDGAPVAGSEVLVVRADSETLAADARLGDGTVGSPRTADADGVVLQSGTTDAQGACAVGVPTPADGVWILVRGAHVPRVVRIPELEASAPITVVVDRGRVVAGRVEPADTRARLGGDVRVRFEREGDRSVQREAELAADGRFELADVAPGTWRALLLATRRSIGSTITGHYRVEEPVDLTGDVRDLTLDVASIVATRAPGSITLRVRRDGLSLPDAELELRSLRERDGREVDGLEGYGPARSDADGVVRFDAIAPGRYRLVHRGATDRAWSDETLEVRAGAAESAAASFWSRALRVRLVDADGAPLPPGRLVRLRSDTDPRTPELRTDRDGWCAFAGLGAGSWRVTVALPDGERELGDVVFADGDRQAERTYRVR